MANLVKRSGRTPVKAAAAKVAVKKAAKKAAAKKAPAKKAPAKHASAKKAVAKKAPAKKAAPKKSAKKGAAKKPPVGADAETRTSSGPTMARPALPAPPTDPLIVLGLAEPFSATQLRRAWRTYAARHHPDQGGDARTFDRGRGAYEALREGMQ